MPSAIVMPSRPTACRDPRGRPAPPPPARRCAPARSTSISIVRPAAALTAATNCRLLASVRPSTANSRSPGRGRRAAPALPGGTVRNDRVGGQLARSKPSPGSSSPGSVSASRSPRMRRLSGARAVRAARPAAPRRRPRSGCSSAICSSSVSPVALIADRDDLIAALQSGQRRRTRRAARRRRSA